MSYASAGFKPGEPMTGLRIFDEQTQSWRRPTSQDVDHLRDAAGGFISLAREISDQLESDKEARP